MLNIHIHGGNYGMLIVSYYEAIKEPALYDICYETQMLKQCHLITQHSIVSMKATCKAIYIR